MTTNEQAHFLNAAHWIIGMWSAAGACGGDNVSLITEDQDCAPALSAACGMVEGKTFYSPMPLWTMLAFANRMSAKLANRIGAVPIKFQ